MADKVDRLFAAAHELSEAWADMPRGISPWIDWKNRRVVIQTRSFDSKNMTPTSLREHLIATGNMAPNKE